MYPQSIVDKSGGTPSFMRGWIAGAYVHINRARAQIIHRTIELSTENQGLSTDRRFNKKKLVTVPLDVGEDGRAKARNRNLVYGKAVDNANAGSMIAIVKPLS
jgi:hypothetical protein